MMTRLRLWAHDLRLHFRIANRIRRRGPGWTGLFSTGSTLPPGPGIFGMLAIMKNEAQLIEEWLDHYLCQGADYIFLIDNGSTDDTLDRVRPYLDDGRVQLVVYPEQHMQLQHYWTAFQHFRMADCCEWLGIADIDEFWFCRSGEPLTEYLVRQNKIDVIYANWTNFGTTQDAQPSSVRLGLCRMNPLKDRFTKYFFRTWVPRKQDDIEVHFIRNVGLSRAKIANNELQLNHYVTQSRSFWFDVKMRRGDVFYTGQNMDAMIARYEQVNKDSIATCTRLRDLMLASENGSGRSN